MAETDQVELEMSDGVSAKRQSGTTHYNNPGSDTEMEDAGVGDAGVGTSAVEGKSVAVEEPVEEPHTPWYIYLFIWILSAGPFLVVLVLFSGIGYGISVFDRLTDSYDWTGLFVPATTFLFTTLYVFDFNDWDTKKPFVKFLKALLTVVGIVLLGACAAFASKEYPPLLLAYVILLIPGWFFFVRLLTESTNQIEEATDAHLFLRKIAWPLITYSVVMFLYWFIWVVWADMPDIGEWQTQDTRGHFYSKTTSAKYAARLGCYDVDDTGMDGDELELALESAPDCILAYLIWMCPLIMAMTSLFGGLMAHFLYRQQYKKTHKEETRHGKLKVFSMVLLFILGAMWVAASVAGAGALSSSFYALAAAALTVLCATMVAGYGTKGLSAEIQHVPILKAITDEYAKGEILKGLLVITCFIPILLFLAVSVINQFVRRYVSVGLCDCGVTTFSKQTKEEAHLNSGSWVTKAAHDHLEKAKKWHLVNVLIWAIYWGMFFVLVNVGVGLVTTIFLSWLNGYLSETFEPLYTVIIFYIVGYVMFLLPPVPGVPVYLAGGVIVVNALQDDFGFGGAIGFSIMLCWSLKMLAIITQQKVFGEWLSKRYVAARAFCQINSRTMRAIRKILSRDGLSVAKVGILVGGPDWPTSTLTGIMGLNVFEMLYGSQPIVFLITPCVVAGAFLLRSGGVWDSLGGIALTFSAATQVAAMLFASYYIQEEVAKMPEPEDDPDFKFDEEVGVRDKKNAELAGKYKKVTASDNVPLPVKMILVLSFISQAGVSYLVGLLYSSCFEAFSVSSSIELELDNDVLNVIKSPFGYVSILLFLISSVLLLMFKMWASCEMKKV